MVPSQKGETRLGVEEFEESRQDRGLEVGVGFLAEVTSQRREAGTDWPYSFALGHGEMLDDDMHDFLLAVQHWSSKATPVSSSR